MKPIDEDVVSMSRAHERGDVDTVRALLQALPELERLPPSGTWFRRAAAAGSIGLIDFWLARMPNGDARTAELDEALYAAKDAATTRHLLSCGAHVNFWSRNGTPLYAAVGRALEPSQRGRRREGGANMDQLQALL